jgi:hypothetical protein
MAPSPFQLNARVLLVVEGTAACALWPAHLGAAPEDGWSVLEQEEWESLSAFSSRLNDTLSRFVRPSASDEPSVVTLIASRLWDADSVAARRRIALDVLAHLAQSGGGTLVLSHGHQHDASCREALTKLAGELSPEWADSRVLVSARFEERVRKAETRKTSSSSLQAAGQAAPT